MMVFKVSCNVHAEENMQEPDMEKISQEEKRNIRYLSESFNQEQGEGKFCALSNLADGGEAYCAVLCESEKEVLPLVNAYLKHMKYSASEVKVSEITLGSFCSMIRDAERCRFIEDRDDTIGPFGLLSILDELGGRRRTVEEGILSGQITKDKIYQAADELLITDDLRPELDRIYQGKARQSPFLFPVHYLIEIDNVVSRRKLTRALLNALYDNGRLESRRYTEVKVDDRLDCDVQHSVVGRVYESSEGGAVLLRLMPVSRNSDEDDLADEYVSLVESACAVAKKYRNRVLTIFCLEKVSDKVKTALINAFNPVALVEMKKCLLNAERAISVLKKWCATNQVRSDKRLIGMVQDGFLYNIDELRERFDKWYDDKIKTSIYPQYDSFYRTDKEAFSEPPKGTAAQELKEMIGLSEAKAVIAKALDYFKLQRFCVTKGMRSDRPAMHMVFTGNPGTAKTTVARIFARIMRENGILSKGHLVEVGRGDLVGKYVGWTAKLVQEKFQAAMGGVLFIDEAYSLVDDRHGLYGDEAINTIVQEMENRREDLIVIFAGYPDEMERFLSTNPGLRSRIAFHVPFSDYSVDELCLIASYMGKSKGLTFTDEALLKLADVFEVARRQEGFGNGRYVRSLLEQSRMNQASRILTMEPERITKKELSVLEAEDIECPVATALPGERTIGFHTV